MAALMEEGERATDETRWSPELTVRAAQSPPHISRPVTLALVFLLAVAIIPFLPGLLGGPVAAERDTEVFYFPLMAWAQTQLRGGSIPLWLPEVFMGYPIFADGEIGLSYPPMLGLLSVLPVTLALPLSRVLHVWLAMAGGFGLARAWKRSYPAAIVAGVTCGLGSFFPAQIHHENIVRTGAWLPGMLACAEFALCATAGHRLRWVAAGAVCLGMACLGLHVQILAVDLLTLATYGVLRIGCGSVGGAASPPARLRGVALVFSTMVLLGLTMGAVQLIPLVELAGESIRGTGLSYQESAAYSLSPFFGPQLVFPFFFRNGEGQPWGLWTHWESYLYVGIAPLVLATLGAARGQWAERTIWVVLLVAAVTLALGQYSPINLHYWLWQTPGMGGLRAPGRFALPAIIAFAQLAAIGFDQARIIGSIRFASGVLLTAVITWVGLAAAHLAIGAWPSEARSAIDSWYLSIPRDTHWLTNSDVLAGIQSATDVLNPRVPTALAYMLITGGALWLVSQGRPSWRVAGQRLVVAVTIVDLVAFSVSVHPGVNLARLLMPTPPIQALAAALAGESEPSRVLVSSAVEQLAPNRMVPFGMSNVGGYSSLESPLHRDLVSRVNRVDDDLLDLVNARYVVEPARYGTMGLYKGTAYFPPNPLVAGPRGTPLADETFRLPAGVISEIRLVSGLVGGMDLPQGAVVGDLRLKDGGGNILWERNLLAGQDVMEWAEGDPALAPFVRHQAVETAGYAFETGGTGSNGRRVLSYTALRLDRTIANADTLEIRGQAARGEFQLFGGLVTTTDGGTQQLFGRDKSKYAEIYRDQNLVVLENRSAYPRAFVTDGGGPQINDPSTRSIPAPDQLLPSNQAGPPSRAARIVEYGRERVVLDVELQGDESRPSLILTDTYFPGWSAWVDDRAVPIGRADGLFRSVTLPPGTGTHRVTFAFVPRSEMIGGAMSLAGLVMLATLLAIAFRSHSATRRSARLTAHPSRVTEAQRFTTLHQPAA